MRERAQGAEKYCQEACLLSPGERLCTVPTVVELATNNKRSRKATVKKQHQPIMESTLSPISFSQQKSKLIRKEEQATPRHLSLASTLHASGFNVDTVGCGHDKTPNCDIAAWKYCSSVTYGNRLSAPVHFQPAGKEMRCPPDSFELESGAPECDMMASETILGCQGSTSIQPGVNVCTNTAEAVVGEGTDRHKKYRHGISGILSTQLGLTCPCSRHCRSVGRPTCIAAYTRRRIGSMQLLSFGA